MNRYTQRMSLRGAKVKVENGKGEDAYTAGSGHGFMRISANTNGADTFDVLVSGEPSASRKDSGVAVQFIPPAGSVGEEEKTVTSTCTVAKLLDIVGNLGGDFNCFANFDHFYAGNLGSANALELSLKYLPDDLLHSDLPADWTLEGEGTLPYSKDTAEPKWKGKVSLGEESFGTVDFTAKWGTMEAKKSFTKFKVGILRDEGEHDLWVLKDESRTTSAEYEAKVFPYFMSNRFPDVDFDWKIFPSIKANIETSGDHKEVCTVTPDGYYKVQTSSTSNDIRLIASWKCPSGSPNPYHTATGVENITIRTPVYIKKIGHRDFTPGSYAGYKKVRIWYTFYDNLGKRVPSRITAGLYADEEWPVPMKTTPFRTEGGDYVSKTGIFHDTIAGYFFTVGTYVGTQRIICDHIDGEHKVSLDLTTSPATITTDDIVAPTY